MLRVITDIPEHRHKHFPRRVQIVTWDSADRYALDSTAFIDLIERLAAAFSERALEKGDHVCVLCNAGDTHLLAAEFALLRHGCVIVPLHNALPSADLQLILSEVRPVCTITRSVEDVALFESLSEAGTLIVLDQLHTPPFAGLEKVPVRCLPEDLALIIYTSGSTGTPKGVMLTHRNIISTVLSTIAVIPVHYRHTVLSYLPVSHILERVAIYCYLTTGVHLHFAESPRQGMALLKKVRPHYITAVPRILDRAVQKFQRAGDSRHYFFRSILLWATDVEASRQNYFRSLIRKFILGRMMTSFGGRLKGILVGGAALNPATESLFRAAGITVREGYGLTECCGVVSLNRFEPGGNKSGTVGPPVPGVEVQITQLASDAAGEIMIKSGGVMQGYYLHPEETAIVMTDDGWLKTGDRGEFTEGRFLRITGRVKEQFKNAFGEYVSPVKLELLLEQDPWVSRALVVGAGRPSTGVLIVPDFEILENWCQRQKVHWTAPLYMVHNTEVLQAFQQHLDQLNKALPVHEQIQVFRLLHEMWTIEDGTLTFSLKLRREVIEERFRKVIDEMYQGV